MNRRKIVFILASISQPRGIKRIRGFMSAGYIVEVYGFDRGLYNENANIDGNEIHVIDSVSDGEQYLTKFIKFLKGVRKISKKHSAKDELIYSFSFTSTLILWMSGCKNYIYEISDIFYGYRKFYYLRFLLKIIDKYLIKKSIITILTSRGFAGFLFKNNIPSNIVIQPNKVDFLLQNVFNKVEKPHLEANRLVFSFIGAFRFPNTIFRFAKIIGENYPNHKFNFYGDSLLTNEVKKISEQYENVNYFGSYKNPDDLERIYKEIDVVIASYDTDGLNVRIAEPNKLYEALFFKKPIVVSVDTFLSERVSELKCGFSIDASQDKSIKQFIESLSNDTLNNVICNIEQIKPDVIIDDNTNNIISVMERRIDFLDNIIIP